MSNDSPASILFDELGNPVGVIFDGYVYRLQVQATLADGYGNNVAITLPNTAPTSSDPALVVAVSPNTPVTVVEQRPSTSTTTSIPGSTSNVNLLPTNLMRLGATIFNDSSRGFLYIKLGAVASTTDYTAKILPLNYFEVPFGYTGQIDAVWTYAAGFAKVDELTT